MRRFIIAALILSLVFIVGAQAPALAQEGGNDLSIYTRYPSQVTEPGKPVNFPLTL
jgi:hypothetical protein